MISLFNENEMEEMASKVKKLLKEVGYKIGSETLSAILQSNGIRPSSEKEML